MTVVIKPSAKKNQIEKLIAALKKEGKFDAFKHCGILKLKKTPLNIQKQMRDEWD